ncbi:MAG: PaaI family thioesterase [Gemmatimonadaceae bacterium]
MSPVPPDADFERRVRDSFARQAYMGTLGAKLVRVVPGEVAVELPWRPELGQQHGVLHAGVVASIADSACGYAALSLMPKGAAVMSVEFKVNLLAPGRGDRFTAVGRVRRAGRTLTVCEGTVIAHDGGESREVAVMTATMIRLEGKSDLAD